MWSHPFSIRALRVSTSSSAAMSTTTASTSPRSTCSRPYSWAWCSRRHSTRRFPSCCSSGRPVVTWFVVLKAVIICELKLSAAFRLKARLWHTNRNKSLCCGRMFERPTPSVHHLRRTHHWEGNTTRFTLPSSYLTGKKCLWFNPSVYGSGPPSSWSFHLLNYWYPSKYQMSPTQPHLLWTQFLYRMCHYSH